VSAISLFCVPYAGGSATAIYGRWGRYLARDIEVVPLELAGHGRRMTEAFHESIEEAVGDMLRAIAPAARSCPYAIYGHSMGTVVTYELVRAIGAAGLPSPAAVFLSGRNPPHRLYPRKSLHLLADGPFLEEIRRIGGTPEQFFEMKELVRAFLPILRSDYRLIERYRFTEPVHEMDADLMFLYSDRDALVTKPDIYEWQRYSQRRFTVAEFTGGHFFINERAEEICRLVTTALHGAPALRLAPDSGRAAWRAVVPEGNLASCVE
jgi:surfactin synthase thioesterase subunit